MGKIMYMDSQYSELQQIQPDWSQSDTSVADYIKNKPIIPNLQYEDLTTTTGTSTYDGWYYADVTVSGGNTVALFITSVTGNNPAFVQHMYDSSIRVNTRSSSKQVTVRRWYM